MERTGHKQMAYVYEYLPIDPKQLTMNASFENFHNLGSDGSSSGSGMLRSPHYPTWSNTHDDNDTGTKETTGSHRNVENQQAQEGQSRFSDLTSSPTETSLYSWSRILASDSDIWEPYPLNPPPTSDDQRRRSEALQAFLDLAIHRETYREPRGEEAKKEEPTKSPDKDEQDMESPIESSSQDQPQSIQQQQRESIADFLNVDYAKLPRIRDYQEQQWEKHYMDLCEFHHREGHCCVPNAYEENPGLARWVKRQRYQYKLRQQGVSKSTMVPHRMKALERLGFVWDTHAALWEEQLHHLEAFRTFYGHCDVPSVFPANPQLSTWVKRQRRLYRENSMWKSREERLNSIGFNWKTSRGSSSYSSIMG